MEKIEILEENILQYIEKKIIDLVTVWVMEEEELLGLCLTYFYDGQVFDIGIEINKFKYDENLISRGKGVKKYYSFILQEKKEIREDFEKLILFYQKNNTYVGITIKEISEKIRDNISKINWSNIVKVDEDFYIDIVEND